MFPDEVSGARLADGRPIHGAPEDADSDPAEWHDWLGPSPGPFYFRLETDEVPVVLIQELSALGDLWIDADPGSMEDVLDIAFSGSALVVADIGVVPDEDLEDTCDATDGGIMLAVAPENADRLEDAFRWAQEHEVPLLLRPGVTTDDVPDDVVWYQLEETDERLRLIRHGLAGYRDEEE